MSATSLVSIAPLAVGTVSSASRQLLEGSRDFASLLAAAANRTVATTSTDRTAPAASRSTDSVDLGSTLPRLLDRFQRRSIRLFQRSGIDTSSAIHLRLEADGVRIRVVGDHPEKKAVEQLLQQDPELLLLLRQIGSLAATPQSATQDRSLPNSAPLQPTFDVQRNLADVFDDRDVVQPIVELVLDNLQATVKVLAPE